MEGPFKKKKKKSGTVVGIKKRLGLQGEVNSPGKVNPHKRKPNKVGFKRKLPEKLISEERDLRRNKKQTGSAEKIAVEEPSPEGERKKKLKPPGPEEVGLGLFPVCEQTNSCNGAGAVLQGSEGVGSRVIIQEQSQELLGSQLTG